MDRDFNPKSILDIGANVGSWSKLFHELWPSAEILMIEANPGCQRALEETGFPFLIALLGASEADAVPFFTLDDTATGASVYRELSGLYDDVEPVSLPQTTLDTLFPIRRFDFLKIDTQGSELDILRGGENLLAAAQHVLLEVSTKPHNQGAPLITEVGSYMEASGFSGFTYVGNPANHQFDILFYRENHGQ